MTVITLTPISPGALAQEKMGWVSVQGYTSMRYQQDLKNGRNQSENQRFWNFYYNFVYDLRDIPQKTCFAGDPTLAIASLDDVLNAEAREDAEEPAKMINANYVVAKDRIRMEILNRRPINSADEGRYVPVEIVRCGVRPPAKQAGLESLVGSDTRSTLRLIWQGFFDNRTRLRLNRTLSPLEVKVDGREVAFANDQCVVLQGDRDHSVTEFKAGDELVLYVKGDDEKTISGRVIMVLRPVDGGPGSRQLFVNCNVPSTSTLADFEAALDGIFTIRR